MQSKQKGYRTERKIKLEFQKKGWTVIRAGASLGEADLICIKNKKCILLQVKSTNKKTFYYYGYDKRKFQGFPFYLVIDFGYNNVKILPPKQKVSIDDGIPIEKFLTK